MWVGAQISHVPLEMNLKRLVNHTYYEQLSLMLITRLFCFAYNPDEAILVWIKELEFCFVVNHRTKNALY